MSGPSHGGKGDSPRPYNKKNWDNSWDRIFNKNKMQPYALILDDIREAKDCWLHDEGVSLTEASGIPRGSWEIVRSYDDFRKFILDNGVPSVISFDFDLCREHMVYYIDNYQSENWQIEDLEKTGFHCLKWLIEFCESNNHKFPRCYAHSANYFGRSLIKKEILKYENKG